MYTERLRAAFARRIKQGHSPVQANALSSELNRTGFRVGIVLGDVLGCFVNEAVFDQYAPGRGIFRIHHRANLLNLGLSVRNFQQFGHDYGISYKAAFNSCTAESEPSAQKMVELIQAIEKDHIPAVYTIEMSNGAIARTLADETGVEILNMHSMQTVTQQEFDAGETYLTLMRKNLDAIERGLN